MLVIVNRHAGIAAALLDDGTDTSLRGTSAPEFAERTATDLAREAGFNELSDAIALDQITRGFAYRTPPTLLTDSKQLSDVEYDEMTWFEGMGWQVVKFDQIERNCDTVFWFSPEAVCYFLPGCCRQASRNTGWTPILTMRSSACSTGARNQTLGTFFSTALALVDRGRTGRRYSLGKLAPVGSTRCVPQQYF